MHVDSKLASCAVLAAVALAACLPDDTRSTPGRMQVTVSADQALISGFVTLDGWQITFDEFWLSLGGVRGASPGCEMYSELLYQRILDLRRSGPQTVATLYALGTCPLGFTLGNARRADVVLGAGVGEDVAARLRSPGSDAFVHAAPSALHVAGRATRAGALLRFAWSFRQAYDFEACDLVTFQAGQAQMFDIRVDSGALFHDRLDDARAELRFDPYAAADRDGDAQISLEELGSVPLAEEGASASLASRLYLALVPKLLRPRDMATCFAGKVEQD